MLEALARRHRRRLAAREERRALELAKGYARIADALERPLAELAALIEAAGETATPSWVQQQRLYKRLIAGAREAYLRYGRAAARTVDEQYAEALEHAAADAPALLALLQVEAKPLTKVRAAELRVAARRRLRAIDLPRSIAQLATSALADAVSKAARRLFDLPRLVTKAREGLGAILVNVLRVSRTESTTAYRQAVAAVYRANGVVGWQWATELEKSPAPCAVCVAMHGKLFSADEPFATHPGCRCLAIPVVQGVAPAIAESGAEWLGRQPQERQEAVLGKGKRRHYAAGAFALDALVATAEHPIYGATRHERSLKALGLAAREGA